MLAQQLYNSTMHAEFTHAKIDALAETELMRGMTRAELERIAARWIYKTIPTGTLLFSAQQASDGAYVIVRGTIKLHVEQWDGRDVFIDIAGAGDVVGEMSIVENTGRSATAQTLEATDVLWIDRAAFQELLTAMPRVSQNLMRILSARLRAANERIQAFARLDVKLRVVRQLLIFADKYGKRREDGSVLIQIRLTQGDLADLIGATRERVNQGIGELRRAGLVFVDASNSISLCEPETLAQMVAPEQ